MVNLFTIHYLKNSESSEIELNYVHLFCLLADFNTLIYASFKSVKL